MRKSAYDKWKERGVETPDQFLDYMIRRHLCAAYVREVLTAGALYKNRVTPELLMYLRGLQNKEYPVNLNVAERKLIVKIKKRFPELNIEYGIDKRTCPSCAGAGGRTGWRGGIFFCRSCDNTGQAPELTFKEPETHDD